MKLAIVTPPKFTRLVQGSYHLVLGQVAARDLWYRDYYRRKHLLGDYVIVDNGAAEPEDERVPFDSIIEVANTIRADEVVMPDVMADSEATLRHTLQKEVLDMVQPRFRMVVPQGKSFDEWTACLVEMHRGTDFGFRTIGIAKHLESIEGARFRIIRWLVREGFAARYDIHLLGCYEDPLTEIKMAAKAYGWIRGIDTGAPIAYAQRDALLTGGKHFSLDWKKSARPALVGENIALINEAVRRIK